MCTLCRAGSAEWRKISFLQPGRQQQDFTQTGFWGQVAEMVAGLFRWLYAISSEHSAVYVAYGAIWLSDFSEIFTVKDLFPESQLKGNFVLNVNHKLV